MGLSENSGVPTSNGFLIIVHMGVSENVVYYPKPNGFADHYPVFKWLFHWEYIPNIFRQTHIKTMLFVGIPY